MAVAPPLVTFLDQLAAANAPTIETLPLDLARQGAMAMVQVMEGPKQPVAAVSDHELATSVGLLPARVYRPVASSDPLPTIA